MSIPKKLNFFRFGTEMDGKYSVLPSGNVDGAASTYSPSTNYAGKISPTVIKAFLCGSFFSSSSITNMSRSPLLIQQGLCFHSP